MKQEGWIKLSRQIQEHWLWTEEPYDKARAWIDLLLLANYEDKKTLYKGKIILCKRGDVNLSISYLAARWKWDRRTVRSFLDVLQSDGMVFVNCTTHRTTITIVNYDNFQLQGTTECTTNCTTNSQQDVQQTPTTNKEKKYKKDKNIYIDIVGHLNQAAGSNYKADSKKTQSLIDARLKEGFTVDDFKTVINKKTSQWLSDPRMSPYLRPETLFGTKFEGYLNERWNENGQRSDESVVSDLYKGISFDLSRGLG